MKFTPSINPRLLHLTNDDASGVEFVEIAFTSVSKYRWANNNLVRTHLRNDISGSSQLFTAVNPSGTEYIINNAGRVLGESLDDLGSLGTGLQFHS